MIAIFDLCTVYDAARRFLKGTNKGYEELKILICFYLAEVLQRLTSGAASCTSTTTQTTSSSASPLSFTVKGESLISWQRHRRICVSGSVSGQLTSTRDEQTFITGCGKAIRQTNFSRSCLL